MKREWVTDPEILFTLRVIGELQVGDNLLFLSPSGDVEEEIVDENCAMYDDGWYDTLELMNPHGWTWLAWWRPPA